MRIRGLLLIILLCAGCNLSTNEVATLPTATVPQATLASPTRTPIPLPNEVRPTQLGVLSTLPPPPIPVALPTQLGVFATLPPPPISGTLPTQIGVVNISSTPDQAVRNYYALVSDGRYDLSWSQLTDSFKQKFNCCAPAYNYTDYVAWWDSVNTVELKEVSIISQTGNRAVVYVQMIYVMNDGRRSSVVNDPYIELGYDPTLAAWRFEDKRATA